MYDISVVLPEYLYDLYYGFNCGSSALPLTTREAFIYFYGKPALFYKTGTVNEDAPTAYGKYGTTPAGSVGINVYSVARIDSPNTGYRWATHELGHYFEARVNGIMGTYYARNTLGRDTTIPRRGTDNDVNSYGFAGTRYGWQQSPETTTGEEFADMFLGWNYNRWEMEEDGSGLTDLGQARSNFMDRYMASWIALVINRERQKTR